MSIISIGPGLDVFVNEMGTITIRQDGESTTENGLVVIDPDDISALIEALDTARREAVRVASEENEDLPLTEDVEEVAALTRSAADDDEEVTNPHLYSR
jgi:hypothetical protein